MTRRPWFSADGRYATEPANTGEFTRLPPEFRLDTEAGKVAPPKLSLDGRPLKSSRLS